MASSLRARVMREARYIKATATIVRRLGRAKRGEGPSVVDAIEPWAKKTPDQVALVDGARQLTYRALDQEANRVARWALDAGVRPGDVVAILMTNRLEYVTTWLGVLKVGAVASLLNTHVRGQSLAHVVSASNAKQLVVGAELADAWIEARALLETAPEAWCRSAPGASTDALRSLDAALADEDGAPLPVDVRRGVTANETAFYVFTSGTTGLPKAANVTHLRALAMMHAFSAYLGTHARDRIYIPLPLYHVTGGLGGLGAALTVGGTAVIREGFSATQFFADVVEHRCTAFIYVGELCRYLLNSPPHPDERRHRLRACLGNGLRPDVWPRFRDRFALPHIVEFYGSSEGNVSLFNLDDRVGSVGRLPPYAERVFKFQLVEVDLETNDVRRGPDGRCLPCPPGTPGELVGLIDPDRPSGRFDGYADAEATRKKVLHDVFEAGDRWYRTGDLLQRDEDGYFYFVDRLGDTFRWKGENVATSEVTEVLSVAAGIAEANVYGVQVPGADGRAGMASIVTDGQLDFRALYAHVTRDLAPYARPLFLRQRDAIEITGTLKHQKVALAAEGFDPSTIDEPLFVRDDEARTYVPLTAAVHDEIVSGARRV